MNYKHYLEPAVRLTIAAVSRGRWIGEDLKDASAVAAHLRERGYDVTLAYWNRPGEPADAVIQRYHELLDATKAVGGSSYVSIKAPAFGADPGLYGELLARSAELGVPLHFDALGVEAADQIFALVTESTPPSRRPVGCTLPGRWSRSLQDAARLADANVSIRIVKGEWPDPDAPTLDPTKGFLDVVSRLAGRAASVRLATHDAELARQSIDILRRAGTPCDLEVLFGFPVRNLLPLTGTMGVPIRVYLPFGQGWLPYCMRHVRAHPTFLWWLARDSLAGPYPDGFSVLRTAPGERRQGDMGAAGPGRTRDRPTDEART